jgi:ribosomal-protein-alanine N-acetyltransferase
VASGPELRTERLVLRRWRESDRDAFAALNSNPEVMAYFPAPLTRPESDFVFSQIEAGFERSGFGIWCVERLDGRFLGLTGLSVVPFEEHFTPAVEIGWRMLPQAWGLGYATEAARESLRFGFEEAGLEEIVSFASRGNERSIAVMERLEMHRDARGDFKHPLLDPAHVLAPHVLYRLSAQEWSAGSVHACAGDGVSPQRSRP